MKREKYSKVKFSFLILKESKRETLCGHPKKSSMIFKNVTRQLLLEGKHMGVRRVSMGWKETDAQARMLMLNLRKPAIRFTFRYSVLIISVCIFYCKKVSCLQF
jgi:hypothetical protein